MTYVKKQGMPAESNSRLITKKEYSILKKYGVKRTFFIANKAVVLEGIIGAIHGLMIFKRDKRKHSVTTLYQMIGSECFKAIEELINFWEAK